MNAVETTKRIFAQRYDGKASPPISSEASATEVQKKQDRINQIDDNARLKRQIPNAGKLYSELITSNDSITKNLNTRSITLVEMENMMKSFEVLYESLMALLKDKRILPNLNRDDIITIKNELNNLYEKKKAEKSRFTKYLKYKTKYLSLKNNQ